MAHASPAPAGIAQQTTRDAPNGAFTGGSFKWDWNDTATSFATRTAFESVGVDADAGDGRYRDAGHPSATGDGRP